MEKNKKERLIKNKLSVPIKSLSLDKDELRKLCNILQERSESAAEIERSEYPKNEADPKKYEKDIGLLKEAFKIKVTIVGSDGKQLYGYIDEVFDSPNFPDNVKSFHVNSEAILRTVYNWYPKNSFDLFLDFSKPTVFNFNLMPSYETPNQSILNVHGYDATWPNGVFQEINEFINKKSSFFSKVHKHSIYDILLWFLGFPLAFRVAFLFSSTIEKILGDMNAFVKNAAYFYVFIAALLVFRIIFHYLRWVCPLVEYRSKRNNIIVHRIFIGTIITSILVRIILDIWKIIF